MLLTTLIAEELLRALTTNTILMINNSFFLKAIVWMCLFPISVGGTTRDPASSDLIIALIVVISALLFAIVAKIVFARKSSLCHRRRPKEGEESVVVLVVAKKKKLTMPPLSITCRINRPDCRCLCRPQKKFAIPHVPNGYKRVLVPSPGAKCGAREYIIVRELQQQPPRPLPVNKKPSPPLKLAKRATLDAIPEVPNGYTRVLVPLPGTKCGERDYIVVCKNHGELLDQDGDAVMTTSTATKNPSPPSAPTRKKIGRRIGMREKILPFELHDQIIQYSHDHANWTKALMRDYPPEFFLYARTITRKSNFLHRAMGECASRLGCGIKTIVEEEDGSVVDHLELSDEESNRPTDWHHGVEQGHQEDEDDSSVGSDITFVEEDNVQEDVVVHSAVGVPVAASTTTTTVSSTPAGQTQQDGTHVFAADSSCHPHDLLLLLDAVNNDHHVSQLQDEQQEGSGYYIDDKGRKRRFSLRIMAKKSASTKTE